MINKEKVNKAAEICLRRIDDEDCPTECPYFDICAQFQKGPAFQPHIRDAIIKLCCRMHEMQSVQSTGRCR